MKPEVSAVKIYPFKYKKGSFEILAYVDITIENNLIIKGIRVIRTKENGVFISFPVKKFRNEFINIIDYSDGKYERYLRRRILDEYKKQIGDYHGS